MNKLPKIQRHNCECDWNRHVIRPIDDEGGEIKVRDLVAWLTTHMREGNISNIYTDLLKALGE